MLPVERVVLKANGAGHRGAPGPKARGAIPSSDSSEGQDAGLAAGLPAGGPAASWTLYLLYTVKGPIRTRSAVVSGRVGSLVIWNTSLPLIGRPIWKLSPSLP